MESIIVACITGVVTLIGVILSNSKSRAVMEVKLDALTAKVEKHNQLIERTYRLEEGLSVVRNDIETLKGKAGWLLGDAACMVMVAVHSAGAGVQGVRAWQACGQGRIASGRPPIFATGGLLACCVGSD